MKVKTTDSYAELDPVFIGREAELKIFNNRYQDFKKNFPDNEICVINYYGIGGIGKTSLLNHIQDILVEHGEKSYYLDLKNNTSPADILKNASINLAKAYNFEFPKFDLAMLAYMRRTLTATNRTEIESFIGRSKLLSLLFDASSFIPSAELALTTSIIKLADSTIAYVRNVFNDEPQAAIQKIEALSTEELIKRLPSYFATDMRANIKKNDDPFFFLIDTFENLVDEAETKGHTAYYDNWLRGDDGLIQSIPNCLWIIVGREELKWNRTNNDWQRLIRKTELHDFTEAETIELLEAQNVASDNIKHAIYKISNGTPFYVNACVRRYYSLLDRDEIVTPDKFGHNKDELMERYARDYDLETKKIIHILSFLPYFSENEAKTILSRILPDYSHDRFQKLLDLSIIATISDRGEYAIQNTVSQIFKANCPQELYDNIVNELSQYYLDNRHPLELLRLYEYSIKNNLNNPKILESIADKIENHFQKILPNYVFNNSSDINFYRANQSYLGVFPICLTLAKYMNYDVASEDISNIADRIIRDKYQDFKYLVQFHYNYSNSTLIDYYKQITPSETAKFNYYKTLIRCESIINTDESITATIDRAWADITNQAERFDILHYTKTTAALKPFYDNLDLDSSDFDDNSRFTCTAFLAFLYSGNRYDLLTVDQSSINLELQEKYIDICQQLLKKQIQPNFIDFATYAIAKINYLEKQKTSFNTIKDFAVKSIEKLRTLTGYTADNLAYFVNKFNLVADNYLDPVICHLHITYVDDANQRIADGCFYIYDNEGHYLCEVTTNNNGEASVDLDSHYGSYYLLKNISAPAFYKEEPLIADPTLYHFYIGPEQIDFYTTITAERPKGRIAFQLLDQNELPISNQKIDIKDADGNLIVTIATNNNGQAGARNLPLGKYSYQFLTASDREVHDFELTKNDQTIIKKLTDENLIGKARHESPKPKKPGLFRRKK